jgi:hypothetical protein
MVNRYVLLGPASVLLLAGLAALGSLARQSGRDGCALDGQSIDRVFRVRMMLRDETARSFCCIRCAELWRRWAARVRAVYVTDEVTGREIDASLAWFVRSSVVTRPSTGNRVHAFARRSDAERHARACNGTLLEGPERPFGPGS